MRQQVSSAFNTALTVGSEKEGKTPEVKDTGEGKTKGVNLDSLLVANGLSYKFPSNASAVVARQHKKHYFAKSNYVPGDKMICFLNSGADFIDPHNSWLQFELKVAWTPTEAVWGNGLAYGADANPNGGFGFGGITAAFDDIWGVRSNTVNPPIDFNQDSRYMTGRPVRGSAINLLNEIIINSRSGHELERIRDLNYVSYHRTPYQLNPEYRRNVGGAMGVGMRFFNVEDGLPDWRNIKLANGADVTDATTGVEIRNGGGLVETRTVCIPLAQISGLFNGPLHHKLIPPQLASGMKIELTLESVAKSFVQLNRRTFQTQIDYKACQPTYEVINPVINTDSILMADSVMRKLNTACSKNSLEYYFCTFDTQSKTTTTDSLNIESRKAVSRALQVQLIPQKTTDITGDTSKDNFEAEPLFKMNELQARVGSQFYPNEVVRRPEEFYYMTQWGFDQVDSPSRDMCGVSPYDFISGGMGAPCITLERSNILPLAGVPMNNSRTLSAQIKFSDSPGGGRGVLMILKHVKLIRVFLDNVVVRE